MKHTLKIVSLAEAKAQLPKLIKQAVEGEPFVIAKAGKPLVKVTKLDEVETKSQKRIGFMKGQIKVPDDFDNLGKEKITKLFDIE